MDWQNWYLANQEMVHLAIAGLAFAILVWGLMTIKVNKLRRALDVAQQQIHETKEALTQSQAETNETNQTLNELRTELAGVSTDNIHVLSRNDELKEMLAEEKAKLLDATQTISTLKAKLASLESAQTLKETHFKEQLNMLKENKEALLKEFELLSKRVLDERARSFKQANQESIQALLSPVQKELGEFKQKVDTVHTEETKQRAELRSELKQLQSLNMSITEQADKLTNALSGSKKMQGGWGEMILESVLDQSGLRLGKDYAREVSLVGEDGKYRPDAVVYLPQQKHLVIDAKTSFNAYQIYVNAEDEVTRAEALKAHAQAVRDRLNELADKEYYRLAGLNSPDVVIMFIPIESAYVEALKYDEQLLQHALERNVLIATPTTLLTSLNIVRQLWRFEEQNKHAVELASRAEKLYAKLNTFVESMSKVGRQIDAAKDTYDKAFNQLYTGKGNLIKQAAEFKELGVAVQRELPEELVDQARLELPNVKGDI